MKIVRTGALISLCVMVIMGLSNLPLVNIEANQTTLVHITVGHQVFPGDSFIARVYVSEVSQLQAYQFQLSYDKNVIRLIGPEGGVEGVTGGLIEGQSLNAGVWGYIPPGLGEGTVRVTGLVEDNQTASGSGYLADLHFMAVGAIGQSSALSFSQGDKFQNRLFNVEGNPIAVLNPWGGGNIQIVPTVFLQIVTSILPGGAAGRDYQFQLEAVGGYPPYKWAAGALPPALTLSESGLISGFTTQAGEYSLNIMVSDDYFLPRFAQKEIKLKVYVMGDANEDGKINKTDVYKIVRIYTGIDSPTRAADANGDGLINLQDALQIQRVYQLH